MPRNFGHSRSRRALARRMVPAEKFAAAAIGSYVLILVLIGAFLL